MFPQLNLDLPVELFGFHCQQLALGLPFLLGGGIKIVYDIALWLQFRRVPMAHRHDDSEPVLTTEADV